MAYKEAMERRKESYFVDVELLKSINLSDGDKTFTTNEEVVTEDMNQESARANLAAQLTPEYFFKIGNLERQSLPRSETVNMSKEELDEMRQIFNVFDSDLNGQITANELRHVIRCLGQSTTEAEIMDMMHSIDSDGNGVIEFPEFLSLISSKVKSIKNTDQLDKVFKIFDTDGTNEINAGNLQKMFEIFGQNMTEKEIKEMLKEADYDMNGKVGYEDFVKMMSE